MTELYNKAWRGVENIYGRCIISITLPQPNECIKTSNAIYVYIQHMFVLETCLSQCAEIDKMHKAFETSVRFFWYLVFLERITGTECTLHLWIKSILLTAGKGQSIPQSTSKLFWLQLNLKYSQFCVFHRWIISFISLPVFLWSEIKQQKQKAEKAWAVKQHSFSQMAPYHSCMY